MIDERAVVSCYVDAAAGLLMLVVLFLSERLHKRNTLSMRIYYALSGQVLFTCVACFVFNAMYHHQAPWSHTVALISRTAWDYSVLAVVCQWIAYVDVKLFGERKRRPFIRIIRILPMAIFLLLLIINLFTGIVFTIAEDNSIQPKPLFFVIMATMFLYFCASALMVLYSDRKTAIVRFLHVGPMMISVLVALIPQYLTSYGTGILGFAIGVTLLYFSMVDEFNCLDEESQLYNRKLMTFLFNRSLGGNRNISSALAVEADGYLPGCFEVLRNTLHQEGDVIRLEEKKFLMFTPSDNLSALQLLSTHVEEAVQKFNTDHPKEKVSLSVRSHMRAEGEDTFSFLRRVVEEKDAGDPIHGVVSMISEIDRLDKELTLASDIQSSMLPRIFPPYPDRAEFDLYASMTPAKEVGGDFYDFFLIDSDHLGLVIADVSGKGIPAALFMMVSKTLIKNQLMTGCDPATAMEHVNLQLCERNSASMFVTVWAAVVEISTGKGLACNAGHENPGLYRAEGEFELLKYKHGMFAGISKKAKYQNREFELKPGKCIFDYTDGVPEAKNTADEMFQEERLAVTLNQSPDAGPEELVHRMHEAVDRFAGGAEQFDDITMLCMKYYGVQAEKRGVTTDD